MRARSSCDGRQLTGAGLEAPLAEAIVTAITRTDSELATNADVAVVKMFRRVAPADSRRRRAATPVRTSTMERRRAERSPRNMTSLHDAIGTFSFDSYTTGIERGWSDDEIGRAILHDLPRRFHRLGGAARRAALRAAPRLTGTRWDALLAAVAEHVAWLHDLPLPAWVDQPERFLQETWVLARTRQIRLESLMYAPPAFLRHGAIPDPRDLDSRGGDTHDWVP